jgi:hypothetical protein
MKNIKPDTNSFPQGNFFRSLLILIFVFSSILHSESLSAQGNLMIMPRRVVFEGSKRSHELNLANTGQDTARYVISLVHYRMKEDGSFEELPPGDTSGNFADKYVRFFPRSVTLGPNESQTVRIQMTPSPNLQEGEYRSHIYFRAVTDENILGQEAPRKSDSTSISVRLKAVFGISIPVIIRVGVPNSTISLSDCAFEMFEGHTPLAKLSIHREGNMSVYGDITIDHVSPEGKVTRVGSVQGLAVYTPNAVRHVRMGLDARTGVDFTKGKLHIVYQPQENINQRNIAQKEVHLN